MFKTWENWPEGEKVVADEQKETKARGGTWKATDNLLFAEVR